MKHASSLLARGAACFSLGLGLLLSGSLRAQITTILDCPEGEVGDFYDRGFYIPSYPGTSMNSVKLFMGLQTGDGSHPYQISITARLNRYNGPVVASGFTSVTLNDSSETEVNVQMISGGRPNPAISPGSTIAFVIGVNKQRGAPDPYYAVPGFNEGCPDVIQTSGTTPPLDNFRRNGVKIQITGNKFLEVGPGQSIQLAIDHADPGDTVTVEAGAYTEDLALRSDIDLQGAGAGDTILTGTGSGSVITASGISNMELSGFTVQGSGSGGLDAGLLISNSDIVVRNNTFTGNTLGIRTVNSTPFVCSNLITGNGNASNGKIDYGIYCGGSGLFAGNRIVQNLEGGVLCIGTAAAPQFVNNTISDNPARGLQAAANSIVMAKNNIISGATSGQGIFAENNSVVESTYNCLFGNTTDYTVISGGSITSKLGDITSNPDFDPAQPGAYALAPTSPCIDAGDPGALFNDLDGSRNDIGATGGLCGSITPPGSIVSGFVWTSVGAYANITEIEQSGPKRGLTTDRDRPFGGRPWLYGAFGASNTAVTRYAVKIAKWTGGTPPAEADFFYRSDPLAKTRFDISGGTLQADTVSLGPVISGGKPLYTLTRNSGNIFWAHENLRLQLDTLDLENGLYSVRMEGYNFLGIAQSLDVNQDLLIRVNNTRPVVEINSVSLGGGAPFDECSIIDLPGTTSTLNFVITASHADGFLDNYALDVLIGRNRSGGQIAADSYSNHVAANAVWNGVTMLPVSATPVSPEQPLPNLQLWETCAYQFRLRAWARTTNGFGRIYHDTFFDNYALDLAPAVVCTPDLDQDGDVDGDDLAIMAAAFGTAP